MEGAGTGPGSTRWDRSLGPAVTVRLCAPFPRPPGGSALARSCVLLALRFLALPLHARLLVVLATASLGEDPALLDLLVEAAKGALERLVLTHSNFGQSGFTSSGSQSCIRNPCSWPDGSVASSRALPPGPKAAGV